MPNSTEVAGISIGISADIGGLDASLQTATRKIDNWAERVRNRKMAVTVEAKKGESWATIEQEFQDLVNRVTKGQRVPVTVDFDVNPRQLNELYANLYNTIRTQVGTRKIPLEIDYKAKAHVEVTWSWADGKGPPGDLNVEVGGTPPRDDSGGDKGTTSRGRRRATSSAGDTVSPEATQSPPQQPAPEGENFGQRMARIRRERAAQAAAPPEQAPRQQPRPRTTTATIRPTQARATVQPSTATVEEVSGIAAMGTGTPRNAAQRARDKVIADNTVAHRQQTQVTREWVKVSAAQARQIAGERASFRRGAKGFTAEMTDGRPTGQVKYTAAGQPYHYIPEGGRPQPARGERQAHAPVPEHQQQQARVRDTAEDTLIDDILAMVSPEQGAALTGLGVVPTSLPKATRTKLQSRINKAIVGKMQTNEERAARTPRGTDWRTSRWFMGDTEGVDPSERRAAQEAFAEEQMQAEDEEWSRLREVFGASDDERERIIHNWAGKSERGSRLVSQFGAEGIKKMAARLGDVLEFEGDAAKGTLQEAADLVAKGEFIQAEEILRPTMQQARKEILANARSGAVGGQRLGRLRGEATKGGKNVLPRTEAETVYLTGASLQGQIAMQRERARAQDRREAGAETAAETKEGKRYAAARSAYIEEYGPPPEFTGEQYYSEEVAAGTGYKTPEYKEYEGVAQDYWADFRSFAETYEMPKRERKATGKGTRGPAASTVPLSERNVETRDMAERLGALQEAGDEEALPEVMDLEAELRDIANREARGGDIYGSRRLTTKEKGLTGPHRRASQDVRANIGFCEYCGTAYGPGKGHADHPISRAHGGGQAPTGGPEHLVASCPECNVAKGDMDLLEWLQSEKYPEQAASIDVRGARAVQAEAHPERMWNADVLGLRGSKVAAREPIRITTPNRGMIDPKRLVGHRELNRETTPRMRGDYGYLDELTEQIGREGIQDPLTLLYGDETTHGEEAYPRLSDGNHRLAAALRLGLPEVPVRTMRRTGNWSQVQGDLSPDEVLRMHGSRGREELEALPTEVPDVRDITEAMGIGRTGFRQGGARRVISSGVLQKLKKMTSGSEVEKAAFLVGESFVDEFGRRLDVITEAVEAEAEATAQGFKTTPAAEEQVKRRLKAGPRRRVLGAFHGIEGHGLRLSTRENAATPEFNDEDFLRQMAAIDPYYMSLVGDPSTQQGVAAFGAETGDIGRRSLNVVRNPSAALRASVRPVAVSAPEQAMAAMPAQIDQMMDSWQDMTEEMRNRFVDTLTSNSIPLPQQAQEWANARESQSAGIPNEGTLFGEITGGQLGPSPFRWNMGAAGAVQQPGVQPGPSVNAVNARMAAMGGPAGGAGIPAGAGGGFFPPPGQRGGPPQMGPPAPGPVGPGPDLNNAKYNRSFTAIRQDLQRQGVADKEIHKIEDQYETDFDVTLDSINEQQTNLQNALAATPVRALSTAVGQFIAQRVARGPAQAAARRANLLIRQQRRSAETQMDMGRKAAATTELFQQEQVTGISQETGQALTREDIRNRARERGFFRRRERIAKAEVQGLQPQIEKEVKAAAPLSRQLLNLAALTPAIVAGGVIFQAAMAAAQAGLDALGKVAMEGAEAGTGFNATLRRIQDQLAEQAMETGGVRGAVARRFQMAGMEATPQQRAMMEGRTGAVVATNRFIEQRDTLRALENMRLNAPAAEQFGVNAALVRPTGGFMGTAIGAQQSLDEIIGNEMERLNPSGLAGMWNLGNERAPFTGTPFTEDFELFGLTQAGKAREQAQLDFAANLNRELESVGNNAQLVRGDLGFAGPEREAQAGALDELGANEMAAAVRAGAFEFKDANGNVITEVNALAGIVKDLGEALEMPSGREAYIAGERQRNVQMMGFEDQFRNQTELTNPINFFRQMAINRPLPFGTTFDTGDVASGRARAAFGGAAQDATAALNARMAQGRRAAIEIGVSPQDLSRLERYGDEILSIRTDLTQRRLEVSTAAYNQQLTVARRSLSDLVGLTGAVGDNQASAVGIAERQNLELERANTLIQRRMQARQMDMSQREINFNLATSQFTTSGATPAEAAARMEQAQIEAQFAQANLNDQREIFANEGIRFENQITIVDEQNLRALQDAIFAVQQLERERDLEKYTAAGEEYLALLQSEADILGAEIDAQIARGMNYVTLAQDEIRRVYVESGEILTGVSEDIADAFEQIREDYDEWIGTIGDRVPLEEKDDTGLRKSGGGATDPGFASGGLFNTSGEQSITVGEAGRETVAVLRNPRQMSWGGGSGMGGVTININNPTVRNDSDIEAIARAVEETLRQRAALVRPR
jgi:hypothetical protein